MSYIARCAQTLSPSIYTHKMAVLCVVLGGRHILGYSDAATRSKRVLRFLVDGVWTHDPSLPLRGHGVGGWNNIVTVESVVWGDNILQSARLYSYIDTCSFSCRFFF